MNFLINDRKVTSQMTGIDGQINTGCRPIAIAPPGGASSLGGNEAALQPPTQPYSCQICARRKVKCDKAIPICSTCRQGKVECLYVAPPPRRRKRYVDDDVEDKLAQYELILRQHGLLPQNETGSPPIKEKPLEPVSFRFNEPETSGTGRLVGEQRSRYMNSNLWQNIEDVEVQHNPEDEEDQVVTGLGGGILSDPLTGAFLGSEQSLLHYHPTHSEAMILWKTHVENVEPLCKILHIPSTSKMVESVSQQPEVASKAEQCLLFAIYHFAVYSMTEKACAEVFEETRATMLQTYHLATRQALVNARFLKTTDMTVLQALVLFLLSCRFSYDPDTYWILTGVAVRIAQRMGLHRDGEDMGLSPFDVQMRRRVFYQIIPLDGIASHMSGTGIGIMPDTWDTKQSLNINDDQIWPGMTEAPEEQKGATEMIFCLARSSIGRVLAKPGKSTQGAALNQFKDHKDAEVMIRGVENEVEEKYIRYCDIVNPLHFLTTISARSAITALRIRARLPKVRNNTITNAERRELFQLSQKIIDSDSAAYAHAELRKYFQWHMTSFFVWGSWDSLIFILTTLWRSDLLSPAETLAAWRKIKQVYHNHNELLKSKRGLHVAVGRLTLNAWDVNSATNVPPDPVYIVNLRLKLTRKLENRAETQDGKPMLLPGDANIMQSTDVALGSDENLLFGSPSADADYDMGSDFNIDSADWIFWDQLIKDNQSRGI